MKRLIVAAWLWLFYFDCLVRLGGFGRLHSTVQKTPLRPKRFLADSDRICRACDYACVLYFKRVLCLQRSAATAVLLRRRGWKAELVIGTQLLPLQSHAWVEIEGRVANDKPYVNEIFQVLERC